MLMSQISFHFNFSLMSAESNLAGFFPPDGDEVWNSKIPWQPIPIHTVPEKWDNVLAAKRPCQRYDYAMKKYFKSREYKDIIEKFKTLFKYLEESSGAPVKTFEQAQYLYNTLFIETLRKRAYVSSKHIIIVCLSEAKMPKSNSRKFFNE